VAAPQAPKARHSEAKPIFFSFARPFLSFYLRSYAPLSRPERKWQKFAERKDGYAPARAEQNDFKIRAANSFMT
jgi:hypothetical protein